MEGRVISIGWSAKFNLRYDIDNRNGARYRYIQRVTEIFGHLSWTILANILYVRF